MKGLKSALALLMISFCAFATSPKVIVIDESNNAGIEGATVISDRGIILGITDREGGIKVEKEKDFPLTIRCVGFEPATIQMAADTIKLHPATYELSEVDVKAGERPIRKVTSYAREYCTGASPNDTMQLFAEYMLINYIPIDEKKIKGFKSGDSAIWPKAARRFARFANSEGLDSVASPDKFDNVSHLSFYNLLVGVPVNSFPETEKIKSGAKVDSVMGKYYNSALYKKTDNNYIITYDRLANEENHSVSPMLFKIVGMTMDIDRMQSTYVYQIPTDSLYTPEDFIYTSGSIHALAKGKMFKWLLGKKDVEVDCYAELYPVDIEYLTVDEYKEDRKERKDRTPIPFRKPQNLQPLPTAVERLVERVNKLDKNPL